MPLTPPPMPDITTPINCTIDPPEQSLVLSRYWKEIRDWGTQGWETAVDLERQVANLEEQIGEAEDSCVRNRMESEALKAQVEVLARDFNIVLKRSDKNNDGHGIGWVYIGDSDYRKSRKIIAAIAKVKEMK